MIVHKKQWWLPQYIGERQGTCWNISDFLLLAYFKFVSTSSSLTKWIQLFCLWKWYVDFFVGKMFYIWIVIVRFFFNQSCLWYRHQGIVHCSYLFKSDVLFNTNPILLNAITVVHQELDIATSHLSDFTRRPTWEIWQWRWIIHFFLSYLLIIKLPVTLFLAIARPIEF